LNKYIYKEKVTKYFISLKFTFEHGQIKEDSNGTQSEPALHGFE